MSELVPLPPEEPKVRYVVPGSKPPPTGDEREQARTAIQHLAWILDSAFEIPGTKFRIGIDPILGLIPVLGDLISMVIGGYIIMLVGSSRCPAGRARADAGERRHGRVARVGAGGGRCA